MGDSVRGHGKAYLVYKGTGTGTPTSFIDPRPGGTVTAKSERTAVEGHAAAYGQSIKPRTLKTRTFEMTIPSHLYYDGLGVLLNMALGTDDTTGPSGSNYTHTYGRALDPDVFAIEVVYSDEIANSRMMTGCRCSAWSMDFPLNSDATIDLTMLGLAFNAESTHTALSDRTDRTYVSANDCTTLTLNSVNLLTTGTVQGLSISGENSLNTRRTFGSASPNALMGTSQGTVSASLTVHVDSTTYNDYQALHEAGTEVTLVAGFTAATGETFTVTLNGALVGESAEPIAADTGPIELTINLLCRATTSTPAITVVVVNTKTTAVVN
jgi:hypothetical protein